MASKLNAELWIRKMKTGNFVVKADGPQKIWEHTAPWINGFGVKVEVRVMLTDEEFVETAKKLGFFLIR